MTATVIVLGEYNPALETHVATDAAIEHSSSHLGRSLETSWCSTSDITRGEIEAADGFWIASGAPYKSMDVALDVIQYARERAVPCLGTCQGFQHIMLEYARAFLGIQRPGHCEYDPDCERPFISKLNCSLRGRAFKVELHAGTLAYQAYGASSVTEHFSCSCGINPDFASQVRSGPIRVSGIDSDGEIRIVEYPEHPFLVGTLFVPQARSTASQPHPLVNAFIRAITDGSS